MELTINYLAVIACGVAAMVIGFLWYGPLFGKPWKKEMGYTNESMKAMKQSPNQSYAIMAVGALLQAYVLSVTLGISEVAFGPLQLGMAMQGAFWLWLGFIATVQVGAVLWENKSWKLFFLNASYSFVVMQVMAAIIASWR